VLNESPRLDCDSDFPVEFMKALLKSIKRMVAACLSEVIVRSPVSLGLQHWAIRHLLPMDPWPKSIVYQQCLADRILRVSGAVVQDGPFKGMTCLRDAREGCLVPKLLGCYEEELIPAAESFIARGCDRIIDVGCASGYWLTGFAWRLPKAEAFGFDIDPQAVARCRQLLALNRVESRVQLMGLGTPADLERLIRGRTLVFVDCDGPEYDLLDPQLAPALRRADIIVECHDFIDARITPTLLERFKHSHVIERISSRSRALDADRYPGLRVLLRKHWAEALAERRPCVQEWLVMRAKEASQP
jgi:hypothetical protein